MQIAHNALISLASDVAAGLLWISFWLYVVLAQRDLRSVARSAGESTVGGPRLTRLFPVLVHGMTTRRFWRSSVPRFSPFPESGQATPAAAGSCF